MMDVNVKIRKEIERLKKTRCRQRSNNGPGARSFASVSGKSARITEELYSQTGVYAGEKRQIGKWVA
ncbi:MAG TPA: hypothetical protein GXX34_03530 [Clostridia bacterium]|nr:hypothetical protein [Clostridia bacterium]